MRRKRLTKQSKIISGLDGKWATIERAAYVLIVKTYNYFGFYGVFVLLYFVLVFFVVWHTSCMFRDACLIQLQLKHSHCACSHNYFSQNIQKSLRFQGFCLFVFYTVFNKLHFVSYSVFNKAVCLFIHSQHDHFRSLCIFVFCRLWHK